jgi:hypothetical protein
MRKPVTVTITIDCPENTNPDDAQVLLDNYVFKLEGLQNVHERLKKKDWSLTQVTKNFITAK